MKRLLNFLLFLLIVGGIIFGVYYYFFLYNVCDLPISVTVDNIDPKFNVTRNDVEAVTNEATYRWNSQSGEVLFNQNSKNNIKINLVYDSRQQELDKINSQITSLDNSKSSIENYKNEYESLLNQYQKDLQNYNSEVDHWNSLGGAPQDVYTRLSQERIQLDRRKNDLISMSQALNVNVQSYNENLDSLKNDLDKRKNIIVTQGEYDSSTKTINIFTFGNKNELRLVLMHELGHGLNLGHAKNKYSIMYELLDEQSLDNPTLTAEDINMLSQKCNLNKNLFNSLRTITSAI